MSMIRKYHNHKLQTKVCPVRQPDLNVQSVNQSAQSAPDLQSMTGQYFALSDQSVRPGFYIFDPFY